jgi:chromosome partitioning protein
MTIMPLADQIGKSKQAVLRSFVVQKHPGSICVANYKGGVGKTTVVCLLGYYLAELTEKKVLLFDIDPQCSLSLAVGFDPDDVSRADHSVYNLGKPSKWTKVSQTKFANYVQDVPDWFRPRGLSIIPGAFEVENLDIECAQSLIGGRQHEHELFLYCKQMLNAFDDFGYILIDCPPNKMYLTQAMLRACAFYLPVTIPDAISVYGMPRLLRWVRQIPANERPRLLGYVLNAINRTGGVRGGMVYSQQASERDPVGNIAGELEPVERAVIGEHPRVGAIPRLDAIARFLGERRTKTTRMDFGTSTSGQPTIDDCLSGLTKEILKRMEAYNAAS